MTSQFANYIGSSTYLSELKSEWRGETTESGTFPANAFGLSDMHGNVGEWCEDVFHYSYEGAPTDGSAWVTGGEQHLRIQRGGSWHSKPGHCCSAYRGVMLPEAKEAIVGFRVATILA
jgi:formylglycine-generating enzyme required for sulfatase activity